MGWPTAEFFVDVIFSTTHALRAFWSLLERFPSCTWPDIYICLCPARALTLLCGQVRVSLKKGDVNKKFRRGRGYLQIVQERSGVAHSCLSTLGIGYSVGVWKTTFYSYFRYFLHTINQVWHTCIMCMCAEAGRSSYIQGCAAVHAAGHSHIGLPCGYATWVTWPQ